MNSVYMDQLSWVEYEHRVRDGAVLFLPCGATEQHGPHLPLGTDARASRAIISIRFLFTHRLCSGPGTGGTPGQGGAAR